MTAITIDRAVVLQVLDALEAMNPYPASKEDQRAAALTALRTVLAQEQAKTCAWRDNLDTIYETECGNLHIVNDGTLEENGMKYCCYCGKGIKDESPT